MKPLRRIPTSSQNEVRIQKYLSQAGVASRRGSEPLILAGRVRVNGHVVRTLGSKVVPGKDKVEVDGKVVKGAKTRWVAFHKPRGAVSTRNDPQGRQTVYDHLPKSLGDLRYVGRLDLLTEGLLLLTNDGDIQHRLTHPSFEIDREYHVWAEGKPGRAVIGSLLKGVDLEDGPAQVARAELLGASPEGATLSVVLREGRNREVRRLMEAVGHPVLRLQRIRFGPISLGKMKPGEWRELSPKEIRSLRGAVGVEK